MTQNGREQHRCALCGEVHFPWEMVNAHELSDALRTIVRDRRPAWDGGSAICASCLLQARTEYTKQRAEADPPENEFHGPTPNLLVEMNRHRTVGEKTADLIAGFVGSWTFLISQLVLLALWIAFNSWALFIRHFDPYPFIFLNLVLSWIAALQAPLILMSQNRQDTRDRLRDEQEFTTNVQAAEEIRQLQYKLDRLLSQHWPAMLEEQRTQAGLLRDFLVRFSKSEPDG